MKKRTLLAAGILLAAAATFVTSCSKTDNALPPIGGYNTSNEVAATNLKAHWSFENSTKEDISGVDVTKASGNSFTTGVKGQGIALNNGYLMYGAIPNLQSETALPSFSISMWVNVKNTSNSFTQFFTLAPSTTNAFDIWGNINVNAETGWFAATADTLVPKVLMEPQINGGASGQDNRPDPRGTPPVGVFKSAGKWAHIVAIWDQSTSKLQVYGNGVLISNPAWETRSAGGNPIGAATFKANDAVIIGSMLCSELGYTKQGSLPSWSKWLTGSVDEVRVYNKALSITDVNSLYQLELAGR